MAVTPLRSLAALFAFTLGAVSAFCADTTTVVLPLLNPGFETGLEAWRVFEAQPAMSRVDGKSAKTGKAGLRIEDSDTKLGSHLESSPLPAVAGLGYHLTFQARSVSTVHGIGIYLRFKDAAGKFIGEPQNRALPPNEPEWAAYDLSVIAPAGTDTVIVWVHSFSTSTGAWDIDDFKLEEIQGTAGATAGVTAAKPLTATGAAKPFVMPKLPETPVPVVLKVDDLSTGGGNVPKNWKRITDFAKERKIKLSIGIITQSLETANPSYINYIKELHANGLFEFWFHGYDHKMWDEGDKKLQEFKGTSYEHQKDHFVKSQTLAKEKLGFTFAVFGSPFNGFDANTSRVLQEDTDMKVFLYGDLADKSSGKVILDRVGAVNIENPLFVPSSEKFITGYAKTAKGRKFFVAQGHPNQWDDARWAEFVKIVDFLQQNQIPIIFAEEAAALATK